MKVFDLELHDNETVIFKVRQHWLVLLWPTVRFLLTAAAGAAAAYLLRNRIEQMLLMLLYLSWVLLTFNFWVHAFLKWYLKMYVVTNYRIINITHKNIFARQVTEASLQRVQDVTHQTLGVLSLMLNFGDVIVQTAGHKTLIHFRMVPRSRHIYRELNGLVMKNHQLHGINEL